MVEATKSLILLDFWHFRDVWLLTTERAEAVRSAPALGLEWRWVRRFAGRLPACPRYERCCVCGDRVPESCGVAPFSVFAAVRTRYPSVLHFGHQWVSAE